MRLDKLGIYLAIGISTGVALIVCIVSAVWVCRQFLKAKRNKLLWLVNWDDLVLPLREDSEVDQRLREDAMRAGDYEKAETSSIREIEARDGRIYNKILPCGVYWKDKLYMARLSPKYRLSLSTRVKQDVKRVQDLNKVEHENVAKFGGACLDPDHVLVLYEYCSKGTLQVKTVYFDALASFLLEIIRLSYVNKIPEREAYLHLNTTAVVNFAQ